MQLSRFVALAAVLVALSGCNGPKDTCRGSYDSYYSMLTGQNWSGMYEMLTPDHRKKWTPERYERAMQAMWGPTKGFSLKTGNISETQAGLCIVNGEMSYTYKERGQQPEDIDGEYFSWTFHKLKDGKWYIDVPGQEKLQGF